MNCRNFKLCIFGRVFRRCVWFASVGRFGLLLWDAFLDFPFVYLLMVMREYEGLYGILLMFCCYVIVRSEFYYEFLGILTV